MSTSSMSVSNGTSQGARTKWQRSRSAYEQAAQRRTWCVGTRQMAQSEPKAASEPRRPRKTGQRLRWSRSVGGGFTSTPTRARSCFGTRRRRGSPPVTTLSMGRVSPAGARSVSPPEATTGSADLLFAYRYLPDELPLVSRVRETELGRERLPVATEDLEISGVPFHRTVVALTRQRYEHPLSTVICREIARILAAFG